MPQLFQYFFKKTNTYVQIYFKLEGRKIIQSERAFIKYTCQLHENHANFDFEKLTSQIIAKFLYSAFIKL